MAAGDGVAVGADAKLEGSPTVGAKANLKGASAASEVANLNSAATVSAEVNFNCAADDGAAAVSAEANLNCAADDGAAENHNGKQVCDQQTRPPSDCDVQTVFKKAISQPNLVPCPAGGAGHVFKDRAYSCPSQQCRSK